ncbi:hypothetical protein K493DRAFT_340366 [Basidiobolus meristosporus CBS 931.73]|uniref:ZZ-type domain-containing protein n=1 Tax=Basidiobolus meristosporus CBS 931.73 TaxID=1314790 RepID=A0A1Y1VWA4_9FUNG|nr:hypothetical protein K493DRAFT_343294 [Basidiobolus meristosporus CBS 931.73]ORX89874.1 hypothetical protein K493DRAFT_340366 [Basidiobolus meristosporus CBS 931.73]|eukprot:ORX65034.1 hypothetical protein K493DRAFT_343294 [Basidiobolus meristosporus CBS 931.73]
MPRLSGNIYTQTSDTVSTENVAETTPRKRRRANAKVPEESVTPNVEDVLTGNDDYLLVTSAMDVLRHQLDQARKDISKLSELKEKALADPITFVTQLRERRNEKPPKLQRVVAIPAIDLDKYVSRVKRGTQDISLNFSPLQRPPLYKSILSSTSAQLPADGVASATASKASSPTSIEIESNNKADVKQEELNEYFPPSQTATEVKSNKRSINDVDQGDKPMSFNQPWSDEEQARLVAYLDEFPEEPIQSQRFLKISKALGTRTPKQVASRVQKYFIKLAKAGLPVPGRMPNMAIYNKPAASSRKPSEKKKTPPPKKQKTESRPGYSNRYIVDASYWQNKLLTCRIRFSGAQYLTGPITPTVLMSDDDEAAESSTVRAPPAARKSTPKSSPPAAASSSAHHGYKCDNCLIEPIVGARWTCTDCDEDHQVDLCNSCHASGDFQNDHHDPSHAFQKVSLGDDAYYYQDNDYNEQPAGEYSYLVM